MASGRPPTDFAILKEIHRRYRDEFGGYGLAAPSRAAKIMVPIDIPAVAERFGVDPDSIFGRLYYHLQPKYGEEPRADGGTRKAFFTPTVANDANCVNFPLLEAVLAGLWQERRRDQLALWTAVLSLGIAIAAIVVSVVAA